MAEHCFCRYGIGAVLTLSTLAAFLASASEQWSPGRLTGVTKEESVNPDRIPAVREPRDAGNQEGKSTSVNITYFEVTSAVFAHFATVTIDSEVTNTAKNESQQVTFDLGVPTDAFLLSNFKVFVDGDDRMGQVLDGEEAEQWYQEGRGGNRSGGRMERRHDISLERGLEPYTVSLWLTPSGNVSFTVAYVELLERREGVYTQTLMVQPGAIVHDLTVTVKVTEPQGFTGFNYTLPGSNETLSSSSPGKQTELKTGMNSRELVFRPRVEMQRQFDKERGIHGMLTISYSLKAEPQGGSILVQKDSFVHSFAPPTLPVLPKNILFVIDISGSMRGVKIQQARQAMLKILNDLKARATDSFNLLLFDDRIEMWQSSPAPSSPQDIERAKDFVRTNLVSRGGTDIHQALTEGLSILLGNQTVRSCHTADMIIFLTDGAPTSGITNTDQIISIVTSQNNNRSSIYALGFGSDVKIEFLRNLSLNNQGFHSRIDVNKDAKDQLTGFYRGISSPVLCDVVASYNAHVVNTDLLSTHAFPMYFEGREILVAGRTRMAKPPSDSSEWDAKLTGSGPSGQVSFVVPAGQVRKLVSGTEGGQIEKLWAYKKIKSLFRQLDMLESQEDKTRIRSEALNLSLTYDFANPMSPMKTVVDSIQEKRRQRQGPAGQACTLTWSWEVVCSLLLVPLTLH